MNKTTTALTELIEYIEPHPDSNIDTASGYESGYLNAMEEVKRKAITLLQKEREDMENIFSSSRHATEISYTSCGDPMMCGCQGSCQHPIAYIKKNTARNDATDYFNNNFTQYKTTDNE